MCEIVSYNIKLSTIIIENMSNNTRKLVYRSSVLGNILGNINTKFQFKLLSFYKDKKSIELIKSVKNEVDFAFYPIEAYHVFSIAKSQSRLDGDMIEVGVYQGGSAKLICEAKNEKELHLFELGIDIGALETSVYLKKEKVRDRNVFGGKMFEKCILLFFFL